MSVTLVHQLNESSLDRLEFVLKCHLIQYKEYRSGIIFLTKNPALYELVLLNNSLSRNLLQDSCFKGAKFSKVFINDFLFQLTS